MPLQIKDKGSHADIWADFARRRENLRPTSEDETPVFAKSHAYSLLTRELKRYLQHQIRGRSFLVSGHRGSGKTSLVLRAIQDLQKDQDGALLQRPLLVKLHGPSLLKPIKSGDASNNDSVKNQADGAAQNVLIEITIALYRALCAEVTRCYRDIALNKSAPGNEEKVLELAGQLNLELDNAPMPSLLREFWQRIDALKSGVLWPDWVNQNRYKELLENPRWHALSDLRIYPPTDTHVDQGVRELVAISTASQAFQMVAGEIEEDKHTITDKNKQEFTRTTVIDPQIRDLLNAFMSLLTGLGVGGIGVTAGVGPVNALLTGAVTALVTGATLNLTTKKTRTRSIDREYIFIRNHDVSTLDRELPIVIERIRAAGLAPVFVVDELDKVDKLEDEMAHLVQRLKHLVADYSFFCFLTDRDYFEFLNELSKENPYPKEHTYFSHRLFVLYRPDDLHDYLERLIEIDYDDDTEELEARLALSYLLMHRAKMHTFDLQRELAKICDDNGNVILDISELRSDPGYISHIMIQLAIEMLLDEQELHERLNQDPQFGQVVYDVLYIPTRSWLNGDPELNLSDQNIECQLRKRLKPDDMDFNKVCPKSKTDNPQAGKASQNVNAGDDAESDGSITSPLTGLVRETDRRYLIELVRRLAEMLANPQMIIDRLIEVSNKNIGINISKFDRVAMIIQYVPTDDQSESEIDKPKEQKSYDLIRPLNDKGTLYSWSRDPYGRNLEMKVDVTGQMDDQSFIQKFKLFLERHCGTQLPPDQLALKGILRRTPDWREVEAASDRLSSYQHDQQDYHDLISHQENLQKYASMLSKWGGLLATALIAGLYIGREAGRSDRLDQIVYGVEALSMLLQLPNARSRSEAEQRVTEFTKHINLQLESPPALTHDTIDSWVQFVEGTFDEIEKQTLVSLLEHRKAAWLSLSKYLDSYLSGVRLELAPGIHEAACVAAEVTPPASLMKPFEHIMIHDVSTTIRNALLDLPVEDSNYVPLWITASCYYLAGLESILAQWQDLISALVQSGHFKLRSSIIDSEVQMLQKIIQSSDYQDAISRNKHTDTALIITIGDDHISSPWNISEQYGALSVTIKDLENSSVSMLLRDYIPALVENKVFSVVFIDQKQIPMEKNVPMMPDLSIFTESIPTFFLGSAPSNEMMNIMNVSNVGNVMSRPIESTKSLDKAMSEALSHLNK